MKEGRLILSKEEKRELGIKFKGDVYRCDWGLLPTHLKTKTKLGEMNLNVPKKAVAQIYTKLGIFDLYDVNEATKKGVYDDFKVVSRDLEDWEWKGNSANYVVLDTETTGFARYDEVIQLSIVDLNGEVLFDSYFNPTVKSHPEALKVHKLTHEFLSDKPKFQEKWEEIQQLLTGKIIIIHNELFDRRLLSQTCRRYSLSSEAEFETCCSMRYFQRRLGISKLGEVLTHLELIDNTDTLHNSLVDCQILVKALNTPH